tara:strand:+ start:929 stop:1483 length:555 start_codon:yes stop_codon:yes gene_type:complete
MIITTGTLKFKKICSIKNSNLRPTSNKVRQAIFNVLKHKLGMDAWKTKSRMLDAFAGTGIVSLEALSRGFSNTTLIEKDVKNFKKLEENVNNLNLTQKVNIINDDFFNIKNLPYKYKLVYLDPPYYKNFINLAIEKILDIKILEKNSIIICETEKSFNFENKIKNYANFSKIYGLSKLTFLEYT